MKAFSGPLAFLSNFHPCKIEYLGLSFSSSEAAYQASKCPERAGEFISLSPGKAKRLGRTVKIRSDWEEVKIAVMEEILRLKFSDPDLAKLLTETGDEELVEANWWGDRFWGQCNGVGENHLGKLLMKIRADLST